MATRTLKAKYETEDDSNEILGDLPLEFSSAPEKGEELPLEELGGALASGFGGALGKYTTGLVSRVVGGKMPGGFNSSAIKTYLSKTWGLGSGRVDGRSGISLGSGGGGGAAGGAVINSEEFIKFQSDQQKFAAARALYIGPGHRFIVRVSSPDFLPPTEPLVAVTQPHGAVRRSGAPAPRCVPSIDLSDPNGSLLPDTPMPLALDLDPDASITGLVDAMFVPVSGTSTPPPQHQQQHFGSSHTRTFEVPAPVLAHNRSADNDHATDLDTEDGVPFGRSHHAARRRLPRARCTRVARPAPTPRAHARRVDAPRPHRTGDYHDTSTPPLGRTTHFERWLAAHEESYERGRDDAEADEDDVARLPGSPSPAPLRHAHSEQLLEIDLPRFSLPSGGDGENADADDPFALPRLRDEPLPDVSVGLSVGEDSRDVSLGMQAEAEALEREGSQESLVSGSGGGGRPRISREEVARRLRARSASPEVDHQQQQQQEREEPMDDDAMDEDQAEGYESANEGRSRDRDGDGTRDEDDEFREEREEEARFEQEQRERERERERAFGVRGATASIMSGGASIMSAGTGASINTEMTMEVGTVEVAERHHSSNGHNTELGLRAPDLGLDFGSRFGLGGLGIPGLGSVGSRMSATSGFSSSTGAAERRELERVAVDMDMRSALDQLIDDVGWGQVGVGEGDDSVCTEEGDVEDLMGMGMGWEQYEGAGARCDGLGAASDGCRRGPKPPDNIRSREQMIIEKRREMRAMEEGYDYVPQAQDDGMLRAGNGHPSARRSMSTGDAEELTRLRGKGLLDVGAGKGNLLGDTSQEELSKLEEPHKRKYHIRQHERMIYGSSSDADSISHMAGAGDVNAGKVWKTVRRLSDMNEYSKQIKEYRAQQNPDKAYGKVFVKVLGVKGMHLPLPAQPTAVTCTLNNGIHFVTTPECALARDCRIEQEFELIEHSKIEFTLTLKVRRDPHIISQFKAVTPTAVPPPKVAPPPPVVQQTSSKGHTSSKGGLRSFWSSSPKKSKEKAVVAPPSPPPRLRLRPPRLCPCLHKSGSPRTSRATQARRHSRASVRLIQGHCVAVGELVLQMFGMGWTCHAPHLSALDPSSGRGLELNGQKLGLDFLAHREDEVWSKAMCSVFHPISGCPVVQTFYIFNAGDKSTTAVSSGHQAGALEKEVKERLKKKDRCAGGGVPAPLINPGLLITNG
ncbi:hypothetical protein K438DRAFT_1945962 [Mycena galopus ATCC 62051]|nr:hypothetical protein K438DRAFT_1945962 [Mycena galopus ATCC 62051]